MKVELQSFLASGGHRHRSHGVQNVLKCNIYCTSAKHFPIVNAIYARYLPEDPPARIYVCVPEWTGPFDVEIDCVAVV